MLEILKFARAAIDKSGNNLAFRHFRIYQGTITASNGSLTIQTPFPVELNCCPHAEQFIRAVTACEGPPALHLEGGRLVVVSGRFKSHVSCWDSAKFPMSYPTGSRFPLSAPVLPVLRKLLPFVAQDGKQAWANGILFSNNSAYATNSICLVEHRLPLAFPVIVNLPRDVASELVRLKVEPEALQVDPHSVTFHLPGGAWVTCKVMVYQWPDVQRIFQQSDGYAGPFVDASALSSLLDDVAKIIPFCGEDGAVYFHKGKLGTVRDGDPGTFLENPFSPGVGIYRADMLEALRGSVDRIGFGAYPNAIPFYAEGLRGAMVGIRDI